MAAPLLAPLLAFLLGAGGGAVRPWTAAAVKAEAVAAGIYADLPALCAASDPLIDAIEDRYPNSRASARLARVADAVCAAAQRPNDPFDQAELVVAAIEALSKAERMVGAASPSSDAPAAPRLRGRSF